MENSTTVLHTVPFSVLNIWDVKTYFHQADIFNEKYPVVLFGEFLKKGQIEKIDIEDNKEYKILGARAYGKGVFVNRIVKGSTLKMRKYQQAKVNHLFWCKVDTKNGAFGIITDDLADGVGSSNMTFAEIDTTKANPEYVQLLFGSKKVNEYMDGYVTGTTNRKYIKPDQLREEIKILMPPLEEQNRIAENYNSKLKLAEQQEEKANKLQEEIESYLYNSLGIKKLVKKECITGLQFVNYEDVSRWDVWTNISEIQSKKYPNSYFGSVVIEKPQYGANVKGVKKKSNTRYIRITDINEAGHLNDEFVSPAMVEDKYLLNEGDFLIARSGNTVGKTLLFRNKYGRAIFAGYLVRYIVDYNKIDPEYLLLFTKSYPFKKWIESNQRVSGQPNINGQEFLNAPLILPPLSIQKEIAEHITNLNKEIRSLKQNAAQNRDIAIKEFELEIFRT